LGADKPTPSSDTMNPLVRRAGFPARRFFTQDERTRTEPRFDPERWQIGRSDPEGVRDETLH
jgi:hypothetical protein